MKSRVFTVCLGLILSVLLSGCSKSLEDYVSGLVHQPGGGFENSETPEEPTTTTTSSTTTTTIPAPSGLSYGTTSVVTYNGIAMTTLTPTVTGTVTGYTVSPAFPIGISLDPNTGVISGTPSVVAASATYTVTASNATGNTTRALTLVVGPVFTVNSTGDQSDATPGDGGCATAGAVCTFRAAIQESNALNTSSLVNVPNGSIAVSAGEIPITANVKVVGASRAGAILNASGNSRILNATAADVSLQSMTLREGNSGATLTSNGGALSYDRTGGRLTLTDVSVLNSTASISNAASSAGSGGGVYFNGKYLTVTNSEFKNNSAVSNGLFVHGGGLAISSATGAVSVTGTIFESNSADYGDGGGVYVAAVNGVPSSVAFSDDTFLNNSTNSAGGGLALYTETNVARCLFQGNSSSGFGSVGGGGIYIHISSGEKIENSTFYGNSADQKGGAIYIFQKSFGAANYSYNTIVNNTASVSAGGIYFYFAGSVNILNSILSANTGGNCGTGPSAFILSGGYNIDSGNTCSFASTGDLVNTDPLVVAGGPAANGGLTQTIALQSISPARDAANPGAGMCLATDQRGTSRPSGGRCDIGAYEY